MSGKSPIRKTGRLPEWFRKGPQQLGALHAMKGRLRESALHTVCEEARCPNMGECFGRGTATFMILGDRCTRKCGFCAVGHGEPLALDPDEPRRVAEEVHRLALRHAVVTSVTRDDLDDGGAAHFVRTIREIRRQCPQTTVEVLTPDFCGREEDVQTVCAAAPDIFNHNVETVERLTPRVRSGAEYRRSIAVLEMARRHLSAGLVKSGIMVGLGEERQEVEGTLRDLKDAGCDIVTIGQYLQPSREHLPVIEYVELDLFREYEAIGFKLGLKHVFSGPFVRSSYLADKVLHEQR